MGDLLCLDAADGQGRLVGQLPERYGDPHKPIRGVPLWGYAASPLLDGDRLISLGGDDGSVVVALNKDTGKEIWRALSSFSIGYCPPVIYTVGKTRQLIIWHPEAVCGLDPETGQDALARCRSSCIGPPWPSRCRGSTASTCSSRRSTTAP